MLTILPRPFAIIVGANALAQTNGPRTLTVITRSHSASSIAVNGFLARSAKMPALLTSTSIVPNRASVAATSAATDCAEVTSVTRWIASPPAAPMRDATALPSSTSATTTLAPAAASAAAISAPMPRAAPVTMATLLFRSAILAPDAARMAGTLLGSDGVQRGLLRVMQPVEDAARLDHAGIGIDVDLRRIGDGIQAALLGGEHRDVLVERGLDLLEDLLRQRGVPDVEVVRLAPEIVRGLLGLRRDGVEVAHGDAADPLALRRAGAGRGGADVEPQERGWREVDDLPAVDVRGEAADLDEGGRRRLVDDPARHRHVVGRARHLDGGMLGERRIADGGLVHEGEMGDAEQVVDDQLPVRLHVEIGRLGAPVRVVEPMEVGDPGRIGQRRVAHPDPHPVIALDHRIGLHLGVGRDPVLARDAHAPAGPVVLQAVVVALQAIAHQLAHGERQMAMRAAVLECDRRAVLGAEEHDRLVEGVGGERFAADLGIGRGDVPVIAQEHFDFLPAPRGAVVSRDYSISP